MSDQVVVRVPASTANLGPGFDCLGLALGLHNTLEVSRIEDGFELDIEGEGVERLRRDRGNLIARAADALWQHIGERPNGMRLKAVNSIPLSSGLGSSAAATLCGLVAANGLSGDPLSKLALLRLAHQIEGHLDNAAAALYGGLTIVSPAGEHVLIDAQDVPPIEVVIALPDVHLSTRQAREALPRRVPLSDAVSNIGRTWFVARALQRGDYEMLAHAMVDRLHEPYRQAFIPGFEGAAQAARRAGASAVCLSGAGPSLAAFAPARHAEIAAAMKTAFENRGTQCRTFVLPVDRQGVQVSQSA